MKLLTGGPSLDSTLAALVEKYPNIAFAVAWAGTGTKTYEALLLNRAKIRQAVIGTHFYQTHPDVLDAFATSNLIRFVLQPQGVFHPKAFLFWSDDAWELLVGSANLTQGAMGDNAELILHISSKSAPEKLRTNLAHQIQSYWNNAEVITRAVAKSYRTLWEHQRHALRRLSGIYSTKGKSKPPVRVEIMHMPWKRYAAEVQAEVQAEGQKAFTARCTLLEGVYEAFETHNSFADMAIELRQTIAGLPNNYQPNWAWFGSMKGAGHYRQSVNQNNPHLSRALDMIPLDGPVSEQQFHAFVDEFSQAIPSGGHGIGTASRLLAMKRPDQFICFNSKNRKGLCKAFGISANGMDYQRYWDEVIARIQDSVWWESPEPSSEPDRTIWMARAAMLDALYYDHFNLKT